MSVFLAYHLAALLAGALAAPPSSMAERNAFGPFRKYNEVINQGYGYHYYAKLDTTVDPHNPRPWGTPIVMAELEFAETSEGKTTEVVRLPDHKLAGPRLRFQRQLDLAYHLATDPRWAASYARHLCKSRGCSRVTLYTQEHRIPDIALVRKAATDPEESAIDLDADSTYTPRVKLGEFRCTDF